MALPFDRVIVQTDDGFKEVTVEGFSAMALQERVRALLEKRVHFFRGATEVETNVALTALRTQR